jgi:hypothetical protein
MTQSSKHPNVKLVCPACLGGKGGRVASPAKAAASARNGRLGTPRWTS